MRDLATFPQTPELYGASCLRQSQLRAFGACNFPYSGGNCFHHSGGIDATGLFDPVDIKSSPKHHCIYIFDWIGESNEILRVASDGKLISKWKTGDDGGYISTTLEANVILSVWDKSLLKEFTADGLLLREIQLSASINELRIAIKLPNGHFIISQGETAESEHRVCLVDDKGAVLKSIGGEQGSSNGEFHSPNYLVVDESGFILVADQNNRRVVLLSPDLEFQKEVIQERDDLRYPVRMDLDHTSGRLFVADNDYLEGHTGWRDGRVMAFDFAIQQ